MPLSSQRHSQTLMLLTHGHGAVCDDPFVLLGTAILRLSVEDVRGQHGTVYQQDAALCIQEGGVRIWIDLVCGESAWRIEQTITLLAAAACADG